MQFAKQDRGSPRPRGKNEGNAQDLERTAQRLRTHSIGFRHDRDSNQIHDIIRQMGLFSILPERLGCDVPDFLGSIPGLESQEINDMGRTLVHTDSFV